MQVRTHWPQSPDRSVDAAESVQTVLELLQCCCADLHDGLSDAAPLLPSNGVAPQVRLPAVPPSCLQQWWALSTRLEEACDPTVMCLVRIGRVGFGTWSDREWSLNERHRLHIRIVRVALSTGYNCVRGSWAGVTKRTLELSSATRIHADDTHTHKQ